MDAMPSDSPPRSSSPAGASGIGAAVTDSFPASGARGTVLDQRPLPRPEVLSVVGDVRSYADNERAVDTAATEGRLDVLIANAGIHDGGLGLLDAGPARLEATFRLVFEVDVLGYLPALRRPTRYPAQTR